MLFNKSTHSSGSSFFGKGTYEKIMSGVKNVAHVLDNGLVQAGISALAPEIGADLSLASKAGLLQKLKH